MPSEELTFTDEPTVAFPLSLLASCLILSPRSFSLLIRACFSISYLAVSTLMEIWGFFEVAYLPFDIRLQLLSGCHLLLDRFKFIQVIWKPVFFTRVQHITHGGITGVLIQFLAFFLEWCHNIRKSFELFREQFFAAACCYGVTLNDLETRNKQHSNVHDGLHCSVGGLNFLWRQMVPPRSTKRCFLDPKINSGDDVLCWLLLCCAQRVSKNWWHHGLMHNLGLIRVCRETHELLRLFIFRARSNILLYPSISY